MPGPFLQGRIRHHLVKRFSRLRLPPRVVAVRAKRARTEEEEAEEGKGGGGEVWERERRSERERCQTPSAPPPPPGRPERRRHPLLLPSRGIRTPPILHRWRCRVLFFPPRTGRFHLLSRKGNASQRILSVVGPPLRRRTSFSRRRGVTPRIPHPSLLFPMRSPSRTLHTQRRLLCPIFRLLLHCPKTMANTDDRLLLFLEDPCRRWRVVSAPVVYRFSRLSLLPLFLRVVVRPRDRSVSRDDEGNRCILHTTTDGKAALLTDGAAGGGRGENFFFFL